jgi:hypothetical protein
MAESEKTDLQIIEGILERMCDALEQWYYCVCELPCCQSCGLAALPEDYKDSGKYLFFHQQDMDGAFKDQVLVNDLHLTYGDGVDLKEVKRVFEEHGFRVVLPPDHTYRLTIMKGA